MATGTTAPVGIPVVAGPTVLATTKGNEFVGISNMLLERLSVIFTPFRV